MINSSISRDVITGNGRKDSAEKELIKFQWEKKLFQVLNTTHIVCLEQLMTELGAFVVFDKNNKKTFPLFYVLCFRFYILYRTLYEGFIFYLMKPNLLLVT